MTAFPNALLEIRKAIRTPGIAGGLHVAIIMDGNGRYVGDHHGAEALRRTVEAALALGVSHLTLFGFASENWKQPGAEVDRAIGLLRQYLARHATEPAEGGVRLSVIGAREELPADALAPVTDAELRTQANARLHLTIALNDGGRGDIVAAARRLATLARDGAIMPEDIDEARFGSSLSTWFLPDPDLMIRTSGEQRLGNFLLWQLAYAEMIFVDKYWRDFTGEDLAAAITEFRRRDRRFGAIQPAIAAAAAHSAIGSDT